MSQFSTTNNKIRDLFNQAGLNYSDLKEKNNDQLLLTFFKNSNKPFEILHDTGWLVGIPNRTAALSTIKNVKLQEILSIDLNTRIEIPELFLPYLEVLPFFKTPPNATVGTFGPTESSYWSGDIFRIKVDGATVWNGPEPIRQGTNKVRAYSATELDSYENPSTHRKQLWHCTFKYFVSGTPTYFTADITGIVAKYPNGVGCNPDPNTQWDEYYIRSFGRTLAVSTPGPDHSYADKYAEITDITGNIITGQGDVIRVRTEPPFIGSPSCFQNTNASTADVPVSFDVSDPTLQALRVYANNGTVLNLTSANFPISIVSTSLPTVPAEPPYLSGYVPMYTADKDGAIIMKSAGNRNSVLDTDTGFFIDFSNVPLYMPYTTTLNPSPYDIIVERNYEDNLSTVVERTDFYTNAGTVFTQLLGSTYNPGLGNAGHLIQSTKGFFLASQPITGLINTYDLLYRAAVSIFSPATYNVNEGIIDRGDLDITPTIPFPAGIKGDKYRIVNSPSNASGTLTDGAGSYTVDVGDIIICIKDTEGGDSTAWFRNGVVTQNDTYKTDAQNILTPGVFWRIDSPTNSVIDNKNGRINDIYLSENADIQYKLLIILRNPYFFQETRHYDLNQ